MVLNKWEILIHQDIQELLDQGVTIEDISNDSEIIKWLFRVTPERIFKLIREAQKSNIYIAYYRNTL